ncbi:MAG: DNA repair protein RecO [Ignavibacteria bacterium]
MSLVKTEAIVLKTDNYRDKSKIVTLFSKSYGKLRCIAKGVRDVKSRWGGVLQPMAYLSIIFYYKENKTLHLLSNAEYKEVFHSLYDNHDKVKLGYRIAELVNGTTIEQHENPDLFELLKFSLESLNNSSNNYVNVFFDFEMKLAKVLGFGIELSPTLPKKSIENNNENRYYSNTVRYNTTVKDAGISGYYGKLREGDLMILETINSGNFKETMKLNISRESEEFLGRFFDDYFKKHVDNLSFLKTKKVFM